MSKVHTIPLHIANKNKSNKGLLIKKYKIKLINKRTKSGEDTDHVKVVITKGQIV